MQDYTFHPEYVEPYYGLLMNANFVNQPERIPGLFNGLKKIETELNHDQLIQMLRSSWRPSKVAAWIIGLYRKIELEVELNRALKNNPMHSEHLIFALVLLNTKGCAHSIESHIRSQTDSLKENFRLDHLERLGFDWAIAAISWLDAINHTARLEENLNIWNMFKKEIKIYEEKYRFKIEQWIRIDEKVRLFGEVMTSVESYKNEKFEER